MVNMHAGVLSFINIIGNSIKYTIETVISLGSPLFQHYFII